MKFRIITILILLFISPNLFSQLIFEENFDYNNGFLTNVSNNFWIEDPSGSVDVQVVNGNLNFDLYPSSNIGKQIYINGGASGRSGVKRDIGTITSGNIYFSFLISVYSTGDMTTGDGDYFFNFQNSTGSVLRNFLYIKKDEIDTTKFYLGLAKASLASLTWYTNPLNKGETYLVVISYNFVSGSDNDKSKLWINPDLSGSEPTPDIEIYSGVDASDIKYVQFRQRVSSGDIYIDGLRVSNSWDQSPLPVTLNNFGYKVISNKIILKWQTASEVNNIGFEIGRKYSGPLDVLNSDWQKIGFVPGSGNSNSPKYYSFVDKNLANGYYTYRLKQIDYDGSYSYSDALKVKVEYKPEELDIKNYPNPFNPITKIYYEIPEDGFVTLKIYNALGKEIRTLVSDNKIAGAYEIDFDATGLPSGVYINVLQSGDRRVIRKMQLIK